MTFIQSSLWNNQFEFDNLITEKQLLCETKSTSAAYVILSLKYPFKSFIWLYKIQIQTSLSSEMKLIMSWARYNCFCLILIDLKSHIVHVKFYHKLIKHVFVDYVALRSTSTVVVLVTAPYDVYPKTVLFIFN